MDCTGTGGRCFRDTRTGTPALPFCHLRLRGTKPPVPGYPERPKSLGEHIKKRRLDLGLLQREVSAQISVNPWTVANWEKGRTIPAKRFVPKILRFLGYEPNA